MGSPKKQRKKFSKPTHPWQKERILAEKELLKDYGLNRKYEIWKMNSILKNFTMQAKNLVTVKSLQVEKERNQLLTKLCSLGLLGKDAKIEDVLSLTLKDIMERRLQTLVYRKNMASSIKQARQFIIHEHIVLSDKTITAPSYMVPLVEENSIQFAQDSVLSNPSHPERAAVKIEKASKKSKEKEQEGEVEAKGKSKEKETKSEKKPKEKKKEVPTTHDLKKEKRIRKKQEKKPEVGKK
jgi:small subunit ribosomal protein S4